MLYEGMHAILYTEHHVLKDTDWKARKVGNDDAPAPGLDVYSVITDCPGDLMPKQEKPSYSISTGSRLLLQINAPRGQSAH